MLKFNKYMKMDISDFLGLATIYFVITGCLFFFTSGGWSSLIIILYVFPILFTIWLIVMLVFLIKKYRGYKFVRIPERIAEISIVLFLVMQVVVLSLNFNDCGDSQGASSFIQKMMGQLRCSGYGTDPALSSQPVVDFHGLEAIFLTYILFLSTFFIIGLVNTKKK